MNPLKIVIEGDAAKALAELKAVQGHVDRLVNAVQGGGSKMAEGTNALGAGLRKAAQWVAAYQVASRTARAFSDSLALADGLGKFSQKTSVAVETLSAWTYAGELADVKSQELAVSLRHLSELIVQANAGDEAAVGLFTQLGIAFADSAGAARGLEAVMTDVADLFGRTDDSIQKTAAASKLFGDRVGTALIPLLNGGKAGLDEMRQAAAATGNLITSEAASAAEEFNDKLREMQLQFRGVALQATAELLPAFQQIADALQHQVTAFLKSASAQEHVVGSFKGLIWIGRAFLSLVVIIAEYLKQAATIHWAAWTWAVNTAAEALRSMWEDLKAAKDGIVGLATAAARAGEVISHALNGDWADAWDAGQDVIDDLGDELDKFFTRTKTVHAKAAAVVTQNTQSMVDQTTGALKQLGKVMAGEWDELENLAHDLFAAQPASAPQKGAAAKGGAGKQAFPLPVAKDESAKILDDLRAARAAASLEGRQLLDEEYRLSVEKLREQLKDEERFQEALAILDETYAAKRAKLAADEERKVLEAAQRRLDIRAGEIDAQLSLVQNQQGLTRVDRERQQIALLEQRLALQQQSLDLAVRQQAEAGSDADRVAAEERIAGLTSQRLAMEQQLQQLRQSGFVADMREGLAQLSDQWDITHGAARTALGGIQTAVNGVSDGIMGMIDGTKTWGEVFAGVARSIIASVIQMVVQWVAQMVVLSAVRRALNLADAGSAAGLAAAWAPAAVAASIASFGTAAATGGASYAASMLSGVALTNGLAASGALAGFAEGGLVGGGRRAIVVNERGPEFIIPAERVTALGLPFLEALRSGALGAAALPSTLPRAVASPYGSVAAAGLQQPGSAPKVTVNVGVLSDRSAAREWAQSREGDVWWHSNARRGAVDQGLDT